MPAGEGDDTERHDDAGNGRATLWISGRSVLLVVGAIGLALTTRNVVGRSTRVLGWFAAATVVAALVYPIVGLLARYMRRGVALLIVIISMLGPIGYIVYVAVDEVRSELEHLQEVAPEAAARIEESERYGEAARDFRLTERVTDFVEELPERLAGGDTADVIRSATTRGLAYFVAFILTIFLVVHGPKIVRGGLGQIEPDSRRSRFESVLGNAYQRAYRYLLGSVGIALVTGLYAYLWCHFADLPGATVLGIFVGLLSIIPNVGIVIGATPAYLLSLGLRPESNWTLVLVLVFVAWQVVDTMVLRRALNRRSIRIGPVVPTIIAMLGIDLYGIGGALVGLALAVFFVAVVDELAPTDAHEVDVAALTG